MGTKQSAKKQKQEKEVKLEKPNYYGFNNTLWQSVFANSPEEAERIIRADNKLNARVALTIKAC